MPQQPRLPEHQSRHQQSEHNFWSHTIKVILLRAKSRSRSLCEKWGRLVARSRPVGGLCFTREEPPGRRLRAEACDALK
jgi:hypothetical protein